MNVAGSNTNEMNFMKEFRENAISYTTYHSSKLTFFCRFSYMATNTGVNDIRVGYREPAKMVAKLRDVKTDDNLLLLKTNLSAGHGGGSGRYDGYKEMAYEFAVIFDIFSNDILEEAAAKAAAEKADAKK